MLRPMSATSLRLGLHTRRNDKHVSHTPQQTRNSERSEDPSPSFFLCALCVLCGERFFVHSPLLENIPHIPDSLRTHPRCILYLIRVDTRTHP
jgi:hypothetical protein